MEYEYSELHNFLISYFGDYREGQTDDLILNEFVKENKEAHVSLIRKQINAFIADSAVSTTEKAKFISSANLYFDEDKKAIEWLEKIGQRMESI